MTRIACSNVNNGTSSQFFFNICHLWLGIRIQCSSFQEISMPRPFVIIQNKISTNLETLNYLIQRLQIHHLHFIVRTGLSLGTPFVPNYKSFQESQRVKPSQSLTKIIKRNIKIYDIKQVHYENIANKESNNT